jgi:predicted ATPase/DNA-binding SARP family transcriptional activator
MEVRVGGSPLPRLRSRKGLWLLALLALRAGKSVDREWLAAVLWPDCDEAHGRRSLRQSLHDLRLALGAEAQRLACEGAQYLRLDLAGARVDALEHDSLISTGKPQDLARAVGLYRGPLLQECAEEWAYAERRRREEAYLEHLAALAQTAETGGNFGGAAGYLRLAVDADPYREDLQRRLMESLHRAGNTAGALEVYRKLQDLLRKELNAEPTSETAALHRTLREAGIPPPQPESIGETFLPAALTPLVGRELEVRELCGMLRAHRLVTLTGAAGVGKSRLALEVANLCVTEFADGVRWVASDGRRDLRRALVAALVGTDLEAASLTAGLRHRRMLVVLDGCADCSAVSPLLQALLEGCPGLRFVATGSRALDLPGERVWRVEPLAIPPESAIRPGAAADPEAILAYPAVRLLVERATAASHGFELTSQNAPVIGRICRRSDGVPQVLERLALALRSAGLETIAASAASSLRAAGEGFEGCWRRLSDAEQLLLRRLSVFQGDWTLDSAAAVCGAEDVGEADIRTLVPGLVERSWLSFPSGAPAARYRLMEPARSYAAQMLEQSPDRERTRHQHGGFFLEQAWEARERLWGPQSALWFARLEEDHDNYRVALDWFRSAGETQAELRLAVALGRFWDTHGHLTEGRIRLEAALGRMSDTFPAYLRLTALVHAGWMAYAAGDYPVARLRYARALALAREIHCPATDAKMLNLTALVAMEEGRFDEAGSLLQEALRGYERVDTGDRRGSVLNNLGHLSLRRRDYPLAQRYLEQAAGWCEDAGDVQNYALTLNDLGYAELRQGRLPEAKGHVAAALRLFDECGDLANLPAALDGMAQLAEAGEQWDGATLLRASAGRLREDCGLARSSPIAGAVAITTARRQLGQESYARAWSEGRRMSAGEAVEYALTQVGV